MKKITWDDVEQAFAKVGAELYREGSANGPLTLAGDTESLERDTIEVSGANFRHLLETVICASGNFDDADYYDYNWGLTLEEGRRDYPGEAEAARKLLETWADVAKKLLAE